MHQLEKKYTNSIAGSADLYDLCLRAGSLLIGVVNININININIINININFRAGSLVIGVVNIIGCVIWMLSGAALVLAPKVKIRKSLVCRRLGLIF